MPATVLLVGALDTKGVEYAFVKDLIEAAGLQTVVVDFGVMGQPAFAPDVSRGEVATAAGGDLAYLAAGTHKDEAMRTMAQGLAAVVERLYSEGRFDGIMGMGGSGGTSIATAAMRTLPVGVPKLMVSTVGGGDVSIYAGSKDITFYALRCRRGRHQPPQPRHLRQRGRRHRRYGADGSGCRQR